MKLVDLSFKKSKLGSLANFYAFVLTIFLAFTLLSISAQKVSAYITQRDYQRIYIVQDDYLQVNEKKTLTITQDSWYIPAGSEESFIIFNPIEGDPKLEEKKKLTIESIQATDSLGNTLKYTLQDSEKGNTLISIKTARLVRYNEPYTIQLSYKSYGLLLKSGAIRDAYVPAFAKTYVFESDSTKEIVTTKVISSKGFGPINFSVPKAQIVEDENNYTLEYTQADLVGDTGWIQIGNKQFYTFEIEQPYKKSTDFPFAFNTYKIVIPRNIQSGYISQKVFFSEISPSPQKIEQDLDGNLIAYFKIPALDTGSIIIKGYATIEESESFDIKDSGSITDIPKDVINRNTKNGKYWEVDTVEIRNVALQIKGSETDVYKIMEKTYQYVVDKIDYSDIKRFGINDRQGALKTLQGGAAVCMEYSDLFITLLRAMGIPARGAFGYGYSSLDYQSITDGSINHQWAEVYLPKQNIWVPADTTWGESGDLLIGGDLNHFYSHVASVNPEIPSTTEVSFYGNSPNLADRKMNVEIVEESAIKDLGGTSQEELLKQYPEDTSLGGALQNITDSAKLFWDRIDSQYKTIIVAVIVVVVTIILGFSIYKIIRKYQSKVKLKSTITNSSDLETTKPQD